MNIFGNPLTVAPNFGSGVRGVLSDSTLPKGKGRKKRAILRNEPELYGISNSIHLTSI
jgi:hypothetical protein